MNYNDMITNFKKFELRTLKQSIKRNKSFYRFHLLMIISSLIFLILNIYHGFYNFSFYIWIFNLLWNSYFYYYHSKKIIIDENSYLKLLKEYNPDIYKQKMRKKELKKLTKLRFYKFFDR